MSLSTQKVDIVHSLQTSVNFISSLDMVALKSGQMNSNQVEIILHECETCLGILATAGDSGFCDGDSFAFSIHGQEDQVPMTLIEAADWCRSIQSLAKERIYRSRIQQALLQVSVWLDDLKEADSLDEEQVLLASESGEALLKVLNDARAAGVSDWITVGLRNEQITLLETEELAKFVQSAASKASNAAI